jgi:hypothetical protein
MLNPDKTLCVRVTTDEYARLFAIKTAVSLRLGMRNNWTTFGITWREFFLFMAGCPPSHVVFNQSSNFSPKPIDIEFLISHLCERGRSSALENPIVKVI